MWAAPHVAQEAQAAGRIHRLGQTKEIHIKRFAFKDSIDEAIAALHDKIKSGAVKLVDREFPPEALQHFVDHGVARPHTFDLNASGVTERMLLSNLQIGLGFNDGRPFTGPERELPPGVARPDKHGFTYKEAPCVCTPLALEPARPLRHVLTRCPPLSRCCAQAAAGRKRWRTRLCGLASATCAGCTA